MKVVASCVMCGQDTTDAVYDPGADETICGCGAVVPDHAAGEPAAAWETDTGNTPTPGRELGGYVGGSTGPTRDHGGRRVTDADGVRRQQTWHHRSMRIGATPDSVRRCRLMVAALADKVSLPGGVASDADDLGRRACMAGMPRGKSVEALAAAAVLLAARRAGVPRSIQDIEDAANITKLGAHYRALCWRLNESAPPPAPTLYLPKTAAALDLPAAVVRLAARLLNHGHEKGITVGRDPSVLAAGALHVAAMKIGLSDTTAEVAGRAGSVSAVSVRHVANILKPLVDDIITNGRRAPPERA